MQPTQEVEQAARAIDVEHNLAAFGEENDPSDWLAEGTDELVASVRLAAAALLLEVGAVVPRSFGVLFASDARIAELNGDWRGKPRATNVLSWPAEDLRTSDEPPPYLGDLAFAHGVISREAAERGQRLLDYLSVLTVHGLAHCLGHDHLDDDEAEAMERLEARALQRIDLPDPYAG